ncbi:MAG: hypothetical protein M3217_02570 [Actinomycetota bacterium]|nr:hypothetical protein [Actinomycetota bacterium]
MDGHEWVSVGTFVVAATAVGVELVRAWWERQHRAAAEQRHLQDLQLRRAAQERDLLLTLHASLEELRRRALDVLRESPAPQAWENALLSAYRAALFQAEQLADPGIREAAQRAAYECGRVRKRITSDDADVDTHASQALIESEIDQAADRIKSRLRDLDPSTPAR